ncbi:MAG: hypothetical protein DA330_07520 [Nitrososphaera sp.]|nr:hypothetical protein [Nitrososphaera sp.]
MKVYLPALVVLTVILAPVTAASQVLGTRPSYIYDRADILTTGGEAAINSDVRSVDDVTSAEIVIYTIPSFTGHGITKDGVEINDRDMLANYIYNEVSLDGIKGIGKADKNNGILVLYSLQRDGSGGSMRIEVGLGLEGDVTDGTAGAILDSYLVPAREAYERNGDTTVFDRAMLDTVIALGTAIGYSSDDPNFVLTEPVQSDELTSEDWIFIIIFIMLFGGVWAALLVNGLRRKRKGLSFFPPSSGRGSRGGGGWSSGGGSSGGGGGRSGGGGAGR